MAPSSRDRISVDLRGLKSALIERARAHSVSPSDFVRAVLAHALNESLRSPSMRAMGQSDFSSSGGRVRLSLRLSRQDKRAIVFAADRAGLSIGAYVAGLAAGIPAVANGALLADNLAVLVASNATMATLSRDLRHLTSLLGQGSIRAAQEYRETLDSVAGDVRRHLAFASSVLADLRPLRVQTKAKADRDAPTRGEAT
jgi:uncharacterized protein (DUF1778 family)